MLEQAVMVSRYVRRFKVSLIIFCSVGNFSEWADDLAAYAFLQILQPLHCHIVLMLANEN